MFSMIEFLEKFMYKNLLVYMIGLFRDYSISGYELKFWDGQMVGNIVIEILA